MFRAHKLNNIENKKVPSISSLDEDDGHFVGLVHEWKLALSHAMRESYPLDQRVVVV